jgi:hypothetical protein
LPARRLPHAAPGRELPQVPRIRGKPSWPFPSLWEAASVADRMSIRGRSATGVGSCKESIGSSSSGAGPKSHTAFSLRFDAGQPEGVRQGSIAGGWRKTAAYLSRFCRLSDSDAEPGAGWSDFRRAGGIPDSGESVSLAPGKNHRGVTGRRTGRLFVKYFRAATCRHGAARHRRSSGSLEFFDPHEAQQRTIVWLRIGS